MSVRSEKKPNLKLRTFGKNFVSLGLSNALDVKQFALGSHSQSFTSVETSLLELANLTSSQNSSVLSKKSVTIKLASKRVEGGRWSKNSLLNL